MTEENTQSNEEQIESYRDMSWQKLRALMATEGQEWQGQEHAIEFLERLDAGDTAGADDEDATAEAAATDEAEADSETPADTEATAGPAEDSQVEDESDEVVTADELVSEPKDNKLRLDRDEYYSTIRGFSNAKFFQNGHYFDAQGRHVKQHKSTHKGD